ncbi:MAG: polyprenyl synthetase family protein [Syntrophomonadaceae bacterium]|jgi:geranylgeranyl diphosphate synthase type II|nr:polyprenyl synthetase family protein [Syntrophomonadaceae bacterium]
MGFDKTGFLKELQKRKEEIDRHLLGSLSVDSDSPLIHQAMHYAVSNGGKRLRPILVVEGAHLAGRPAEAVMLTACAIEMIHCYSLVHDDLPSMDNDDLRRGKPTCHIVYGEANAILTGDALLSRAFELIAANAGVSGVTPDAVVAVIEEVAAAIGSTGMVGGQVLDLQWQGQQIGPAELEHLHLLKTGALFRAALRSGAILAGMKAQALEDLTDYARHFGLAFQITDDILDVCGDEGVVGKPIGSDERNQKITYVSLFGLEGAVELARQSVDKCIASLRSFGEEADFLRDLARFTLFRQS